MWYINFWKTQLGKMKIGEFSKGITDINGTELVKCKVDGECANCKNEIKKGSYCLSGRGIYGRICLNCSDEFFNNLINSFNDLALRFRDKKERINEDRDRYEKNNMICSLQD